MAESVTEAETKAARCPDCGGKLSARALPWGELRCDACKQYVIPGDDRD